MWATPCADGKPLFSSGKDVAAFNAMPFDLNKKTSESVVNFVEIDMMTNAPKKAAEGGIREGVTTDKRIKAFTYLTGLPTTHCNVYEYKKAIANPRG